MAIFNSYVSLPKGSCISWILSLKLFPHWFWFGTWSIRRKPCSIHWLVIMLRLKRYLLFWGLILSPIFRHTQICQFNAGYISHDAPLYPHIVGYIPYLWLSMYCYVPILSPSHKLFFFVQGRCFIMAPCLGSTITTGKPCSPTLSMHD